MIRARCTDGSFLFGIDAENIKRLKAGKPIYIDLEQFGGTDKFVIMYGDMLQDIIDAIEKQTGQKLPQSPNLKLEGE
jgi:hypothetical protein